MSNGAVSPTVAAWILIAYEERIERGGAFNHAGNAVQLNHRHRARLCMRDRLDRSRRNCRRPVSQLEFQQ